MQTHELNQSGGLASDSIYLSQGPILIFVSLDCQDRTRDAREIFFDIPAAKMWIQPDVVPSPECSGSIAVITRKFRREVGRLELALNLRDALHAEIFYEKMRG